MTFVADEEARLEAAQGAWTGVSAGWQVRAISLLDSPATDATRSLKLPAGLPRCTFLSDQEKVRAKGRFVQNCK